MDKTTLDVSALEVESFTTADSFDSSNELNCTGCDSTCGIIWP